MNNLKGDRRRRGFSKKEMATERFQDVIGSMMLGWLTWGMAIYWMRGGSVPVESCAVAGAIVSAVLSLISRRLRGFTLFLLPILLAVFFGR